MPSFRGWRVRLSFLWLIFPPLPSFQRKPAYKDVRLHGCRAFGELSRAVVERRREQAAEDARSRPAKAGIQKTRAKALPGDRVLLAFINAAEAVQIAVAAGLFAGRADGGLAVAVVLREAR